MGMLFFILLGLWPLQAFAGWVKAPPGTDAGNGPKGVRMDSTNQKGKVEL